VCTFHFFLGRTGTAPPIDRERKVRVGVRWPHRALPPPPTPAAAPPPRPPPSKSLRPRSIPGVLTWFQLSRGPRWAAAPARVRLATLEVELVLRHRLARPHPRPRARSCSLVLSWLLRRACVCYVLYQIRLFFFLLQHDVVANLWARLCQIPKKSVRHLHLAMREAKNLQSPSRHPRTYELLFIFLWIISKTPSRQRVYIFMCIHGNIWFGHVIYT
jgi:hypothetical protein